MGYKGSNGMLGMQGSKGIKGKTGSKGSIGRQGKTLMYTGSQLNCSESFNCRNS